MIEKSDRGSLDESLDALLLFGAAMLRAGSTASRGRKWIDRAGEALGLKVIAIGITLEAVTLNVRRGDDCIVRMRPVGPPAIDETRLGKLERVAKHPPSSAAALREWVLQIESEKHSYSHLQIAGAVGIASAGFAFLNGAAGFDVIATACAAAAGQGLRFRLAAWSANHYAAAAGSAIAASGSFMLIAALASSAGFQIHNYPAGFIASVLFLVPGFPIIAGLFDLLQSQYLIALTRLTYGVMLLFAVAFGLSVVVELADVSVQPGAPMELAYPLKLVLRALATFAAAAGFATLFNSSLRMTAAAGVLALFVNGIRLVLLDLGMTVPAAAFLAALAIGSIAPFVARRLEEPPVTMIVAPIVIMIPGVAGFQTIVLLNRGQITEALQAYATFGFALGALAFGLAAASLFAAKDTNAG